MKKRLLEFVKKNRQLNGFTLIEMVIVIAIIVILLVIVTPNLVKQKETANNKTDDAFRTTLQTQVELYENKEGKKPSALSDLGKEYLTDRQQERIKEGHFELKDGEVIQAKK